MRIVKNLFGKTAAPAESEPPPESTPAAPMVRPQSAAVEPQSPAEVPLPDQPPENAQLINQLRAARENLRLLELRKWNYALEDDIPAQLLKAEMQQRKRIADVSSQCQMAGLDLPDDEQAEAEHQCVLLAAAQENLAVIEGELRARGSAAPIQYLKAEQRWRERIGTLTKSTGAAVGSV